MDSTSKAFRNNVFFAIFVASLAAMMVSGFVFDVGEKTGWRKPTGKERETYNQWASQNRFRIGDTVYFKYRNDSVLVVSPADYLKCNMSNPISKFEDGNTVFKFDRSGFFYFISGETDHCKSGQKLIIRVMHPSENMAPVLAPSPVENGESGGGSGSGSGKSSSSSGLRLGVASCFMIVAAGLFVMVYVFV